jgi:hypothetical protein
LFAALIECAIAPVDQKSRFINGDNDFKHVSAVRVRFSMVTASTRRRAVNVL